MVLAFLSGFFFALVERKKETQNAEYTF